MNLIMKNVVCTLGQPQDFLNQRKFILFALRVVVHERKVVAKQKAPVSKNPKKLNLQLIEVHSIPSFIFKNMS